MIGACRYKVGGRFKLVKRGEGYLGGGIRVGEIGWYRGYWSKIRDMPTWSGIIQGTESSKTSKRSVDDGDFIVIQAPVKG